MGMLAEMMKSLIADTDVLLNFNDFPLQTQTSGSKRTNSVVLSAATVIKQSFPRLDVISCERERESIGAKQNVIVRGCGAKAWPWGPFLRFL